VLIRGIGDSWKATEKWRTQASLLEAYGEDMFFMGDMPPDSDQIGKLKDYLTYMRDQAKEPQPRPRYIWDDSILKRAYVDRHPLEDTELPNIVAGLHKMEEGNPDRVTGANAAVLSLGPACTGSHYHSHEDAFCVLVHGRKYWLLMNTEHKTRDAKVDPEKFVRHPVDYIKEMRKERGQNKTNWWEGKTEHQLECTQHPGDLIYIPKSWQHLVINLWPSIAINHEFLPRTVDNDHRVFQATPPSKQKEADGEDDDDDDGDGEGVASTNLKPTAWFQWEQAAGDL